MNHDNRKHARLSGSKIERALLCAGSVQLEATLPRTTNDAAERGTAIHEIAEAIFKTDSPKPDHSDKPEDWHAEAKGYVTAIHEYTKSWAKKRFVELDATPGLQTIHESLGGTADFAAIGGGRLFVADLKTGRAPIHPEHNPQLLTYALGAMLQLKAPPSTSVTLAIYQGGKLRTWHTDYDTILQWRETLVDLAVRVWATNPTRTPTAAACKWCNARGICPELSAAAIEFAHKSALVDFDLDNAPDADALFPAPAIIVTNLSEALEAAELLDGWIEAIRAKAKERLNDGQTIPGWKLKKGRRMVHIADADKLAALAKNIPDAWQLKTPSALQKIDALPAELFCEVTAAPSLVRGND